MTPTYSIVIPHHNIPDLLVRCLESMPHRNDVQIIVIDDTSSAEYLSQFEKIAENYSELAEFHYTTKGRGGGAARNIGLCKAVGKYVLFVDADDFFLPAINDLLDKYKASEYDVIYFDATAKYSDTYEPSDRAKHLNRMIVMHHENKELSEKLLRYKFGEPWCKIIKRDLITANAIRFDETPIHNDTTFSYLVGFYASQVAVDDTVAYCLTDRKGSVSKAVSSEKLRCRMEVMSRKNAFFIENNIDIFDELIFSSITKSILDHKFKQVFEMLRIAKSYGIGACKLLKEYIKYKRKRF